MNFNGLSQLCIKCIVHMHYPVSFFSRTTKGTAKLPDKAHSALIDCRASTSSPER